MATLIFVVLKLTRTIDSVGDWYWVTLLIALEAPNYLMAWLYFRHRT